MQNKDKNLHFAFMKMQIVDFLHFVLGWTQNVEISTFCIVTSLMLNSAIHINKNKLYK